MTETGERDEARGWVEKTRQMSQKRAFDADSSRGLFVPAEYLKPLRGNRKELTREGTHVVDERQLEVLRVDVALDLTRAVWSDRVGSQASVGQREEGRWRNGRHHPHGCFCEISAVRGAGRWAHYSQVRLYPVRRALRRIQHRVIELESRHRDRLPRRVYLTTELSFAPKPGEKPLQTPK